jgi:hypothetical protein
MRPLCHFCNNNNNNNNNNNYNNNNDNNNDNNNNNNNKLKMIQWLITRKDNCFKTFVWFQSNVGT